MMKRLIIIMGVSGCGKSTISQSLGQHLNVPVIEGDNFHPNANIQKMARGQPLDDSDRKAWLEALNLEIERHDDPDIILACSALTPFVQTALSRSKSRICVWIWLKGAADLIRQRLNVRQGHFMTAELLDSQFEALCPPKDCHPVSIRKSVRDSVDEISAILRALDE